ncbi:hypothetical protein CDD81_552 [Ophiocordyceps australis]|uniref:NAD(P)-binding domain-containing protein n=1 Tax=Ophiocordyceps australis TaxID=1399860 RepID=A0A2C5YBE4_9HYPO|nr:hypothetical protein CDD81_552 [Ophiocordyceps australis]
MHIILTGATGLVGSIALDILLSDETVDQVTILSRRSVPQADGHDKAQVIIHDDLAVYDEHVLAKLRGAHACIWAVGPPYMAVSKAEYEYAHIELPVLAAKVYATLSDGFNFVYVSHDMCEEAREKYITGVKARAEDALLQLHHDPSKRYGAESRSPPLASLRVYLVRPCAIDYASHTAIQPYIRRPLPLAKKLTTYIMIPIARYFDWQMLGKSQDLGRVLVDLAASQGADLDNVPGVARGGRSIGVVGTKAWVGQRGKAGEARGG